MHFNEEKFDVLGYPLNDADPRMNKNWISNHYDEIKSKISKNDYSLHEGLLRINKKFNINVDVEEMLERI